jgi:RNA polymerase sigma-70 factor (ECF subfamily)
MTDDERRETFGRVMDEEWKVLTALAFFRCRHKQRAEDICAEAFLLVWPRWEAGEVEDLVPYLRTVIWNLCKRAARREWLWNRAAPQLASAIVDVSSGPNLELIDAVLSLRAKLRDVVVCRFLLDISEQETARALGIRPGTVKTRLRSAKKELRRSLTESESRA